MKREIEHPHVPKPPEELLFFEQVLAHPIMKETIFWQMINLSGGSRVADLEMQIRAELIDHACVSITQAEFSPLVRPDFSDPDWKHTFAIEAEQPVVARILSGEYEVLIDEFRKKHTQAQRDKLIIEFSLYRVATAATQVVRMMKLGLDPELLRIEPEPAKREIKVRLFKRSNVKLQ